MMRAGLSEVDYDTIFFRCSSVTCSDRAAHAIAASCSSLVSVCIMTTGIASGVDLLRGVAGIPSRRTAVGCNASATAIRVRMRLVCFCSATNHRSAQRFATKRNSTMALAFPNSSRGQLENWRRNGEALRPPCGRSA